MLAQLTDVRILEGKNGPGLRFNLTFYFDEAKQYWWLSRGCTAWRNKAGQVKLNPPRIPLGKGKPSFRKYNVNDGSDAVKALVEAGIEKNYGHKITRWASAGPKGVALADEDPDAPQELSFNV